MSASESDEKNSGHCHRTPEDPVCAQVCKINLADACFCFTLLGETSEIISNFSGNLMGDKFSRLYSFDFGSSLEVHELPALLNEDNATRNATFTSNLTQAAMLRRN